MTNKINEEDNRTVADIEKFGLSVILIQATDYLPSFAYSIGLWQKFKHPEIICFGLNTKTLHALINDTAEVVKNGHAIETGKNYNDFFEDARSEFIKVDQRNLVDYFGTALNYYDNEDFPAIQLIWTDRNDKFPWENDFEEEFEFRQPLLDRNADFKFREAKNLGIFTTKQWHELNKPILRVVHDNDGDWQFLTGDQMPEDAILVALEQMTLKDKTLNQVFDLEYGQTADREYLGGNWKRNNAEYVDE